MSDTTSTTATSGRSRAGNVILWVLQIVAAAGFLLSGGMKIVGVAEMVALYDEIGVGQWFRYVTAALQVLGALALLVPRFCAHGAVLLALIMVGAIGTHLIIGGSPVAALVNLVVVGVIVWGRRARLLRRS